MASILKCYTSMSVGNRKREQKQRMKIEQKALWAASTKIAGLKAEDTVLEH